jgi:hypothetical protein
MSSTERALDQSGSSAIKTDIHRFAALPDWLVRAAQPGSVSTTLTRSIPEFAAHDMSLHDCKIGGLRLNAATHTWSGTYTLNVTITATGQHRIIPLQGTLFPPGQPVPKQARSDAPIGRSGWRWYLPDMRLELMAPPPDPELPSLPQLLDPGLARALLEQAMRHGEPTYPGVRIAACQPDVLRYHPGLRATMRYQLTYSADQAAHEWPAIVVAKTYEGDKGQHAYNGMRALWHAPLASGADVTIAEPIAYLPARRLLIQGPVPGNQTLRALIEAAIRDPAPTILDELDAALHKTAVGLAALHRTPAPSGAAYHWADELVEVWQFVDNLTAAVPELAGAATALLRLLEVHAAATPPDPPVFAHGTFRPNQILLHQGQVGLIDFDSWCQAEPALDLALFLTSIKDTGLNAAGKAAQQETGDSVDATARLAQLARLEALCDKFLAYYTSLMPVSRRRVALWEALDIFTLVLRSWDRVKPIRLAQMLLVLDRHIQRHFA